MNLEELTTLLRKRNQWDFYFYARNGERVNCRMLGNGLVVVNEQGTATKQQLEKLNLEYHVDGVFNRV